MVQDVRNKKHGSMKCKKAFYVFHVFYLFPFVMPLELPLVLCYASYAFRFNASISASGSAWTCPTCFACSTDPSTSTVDMDPS